MSADEPAHFRKTVAIASGDLFGTRAGYTRAPLATRTKLAWLVQTSRAVKVPAALHGCGAFRLPLGGHCPDASGTVVDRPVPPDREVSYVATYPPYAYLLPALAVRAGEAAGWGPEGVLLLGRGALALLCLVLLAAAARLLVQPGLAPPRTALLGFVGLALAVTPMVLFTAAELSGSGPEVAAAVCLLAAALRLTRPADQGEGGRGAWAAFAASGLVLATSRSLGPLWLVSLLVVVALVRGPRTLAASAQAGGRWAAGACVVIVLGVVASVAWSVAVEPHPALHLPALPRGIAEGAGMVPAMLAQAVGIFGWADLGMPNLVHALWGALVLGLVVVAWKVADGRRRFALAVTLVAAVASIVVLWAFAIRPTSPDFKMQGRYALPVLVAVPLVAVEVVAGCRRRAAGLLGGRERGVAAAAIVVTLLVQGFAWLVNAHHYRDAAVFHREYPAGWHPPGGWLLWAALVIAAVACGCVGAARLAREPVWSADGPPG
jgi:hypothetical protein